MRESSFTVQRGHDWKHKKDYNIQISRTAKEEYFSNETEGDYLLITNNQNGINLSAFGKLQIRKDVSDDSVCIGTTLRTALGVDFEDEVNIKPIQPPSKRYHQRLFDSLVKIRPQICRVQKSTYPDPGFDICRISESMRGVLGIEWGDRIVVESSEDRISLRALPITDEFLDRKKRRINQEAHHFNCAEIIHDGSERVDIPSIYIDSDRRTQLGLEKKAHWGACQPVRIYRDSVVYFSRQINEITVPVVAGLFGFIVVFDDYISLVNTVLVAIFCFVLIMFSLLYKSRTISLD